jgi:hypothetical protein
MSSLKSSEKVVFEKLFNRDGYALDFNEPRYAELFREHQPSDGRPLVHLNHTSCSGGWQRVLVA